MNFLNFSNTYGNTYTARQQSAVTVRIQIREETDLLIILEHSLLNVQRRVIWFMRQYTVGQDDE